MTSTEPIRAVVIDFDGTICPQDVSEEILDAFGSPEWRDIDQEFQRGEIGSRECLVRQAELLKGHRDDMLEFALDRFRVDPSFPPFLEWTRGAGIEVTVASDGLGFYVVPMLAAAAVTGVSVLSNGFDQDGRVPRLAFPNAHPVCVGCGTCKMRIVLGLRERVGPVAFVGEGHSDRYGALYADLVFAKDHLVEICRSDGVPCLRWETFTDVRTGLERTANPPGPLAPLVCPGWTVPA
jgi:2-hydroxy-3-keto-5-methylthiopentenyl-1-phosphate phosphatase